MGRLYLFSKYEAGQYGHEPFDFIILRDEEQNTLQIGLAEPKESDIYLKADTNITGIINTDSAALSLTIIPEYPCEGLINPCTDAKCVRKLNQPHHFKCICNNGYENPTDLSYTCIGKFITRIVFFNLSLLVFMSNE